MNIFPTAVQRATTATIGTRNHAGKAAQLLNIEVEQIARSRVLVANQGNSWFQIAHAVQAETAENAAHGGPAQAGSLGNVVSGEALAPQLFDVLCQRFPGTTGGTMRTRRAIVQARQTFLLIMVGPLGSGAGANMKGAGSSLQSHLLNQNGLH